MTSLRTAQTTFENPRNIRPQTSNLDETMSNPRFSLASAASAALVGLCLACSAPGANAQLLAYEGFQYTGTSLDGANGGTGWDVYNWADPDLDAPLSDDNTSLAFPASVSFVPAGKRISFPFSGEVERRLGTPMNLATEGSVFYFSALVKRTGDFRIEFQDNSNNARWRFGANGLTDVATNAVVGVASDATGPDLFPPEETVFIISKMRTRAASTNNDEVFLNMYRAGDVVPSQEPAVWHLSSAGASGVTLTRLIIRNISDTPLENRRAAAGHKLPGSGRGERGRRAGIREATHSPNQRL